MDALLMNEPPSTRPSLLLRIRDSADAVSWGQFVELYAPLIYAFARRRGLQEADAANVTQEVLFRVSRYVRELDYDPARGTFRGLLFTIARNALRTFLDRERRQVQGSGDSAVQELLAGHADGDAADWDMEYERRVFAFAADQIRSRFQDVTWQAFWRSAVEGRRGKVVAAELGISVAAVYLAKSRVLAALREQVEQLEGAQDTSGGPGHGLG